MHSTPTDLNHTTQCVYRKYTNVLELHIGWNERELKIDYVTHKIGEKKQLPNLHSWLAVHVYVLVFRVYCRRATNINRI